MSGQYVILPKHLRYNRRHFLRCFVKAGANPLNQRIMKSTHNKGDILVLDEGTSAVDMRSAYEIEDNLLSIRELTLLSILHKTSEVLLRRYDEIIYMHNGRIVEQGSFTKLMAA